MKTVRMLMAAHLVFGHIIYSLAGLIPMAVLVARSVIGICQFQLGAAIYIADASVSSCLCTAALAAAPAVCGLLDTLFLHELRIQNLVLDSDTAPGWFMAIVYFLYLLKVFFIENRQESPSQETSPATQESPAERCMPAGGFCEHYDNR